MRGHESRPRHIYVVTAVHNPALSASEREFVSALITKPFDRAQILALLRRSITGFVRSA
jgi:hypothetical protein